jgi:hypothetical protein
VWDTKKGTLPSGLGSFENSHLYKHLRDELMNGDEDEFNNFLDFVADIIQAPHKIRGVSHLFYTAQGMGKGLMAKWLSKLVGADYVITYNNVSTYFKDFNSDATCKLIKILEEVAERGDAFHKHDILKADQTKLTERVEPKGLDPYHIKHYARYIYFTNNEHALYIENTDRRHTLHKANNRYADNQAYFAPIVAEIDDYDFCKSSFEFFASRVYDEQKQLKAYITKYKLEQKQNNLPTGLKYLKDLAENDFEGLRQDGDKFRCKDVAEHFRQWCTDHGTKYNLASFKTQIKKLDIDGQRLQFEGDRVKCYTLHKGQLRDKFAEYLRDPTFYFEP